MKLRVDDREDDLKHYLEKLCEVERVRLELGDVETDKVIIERKGLEDLASSVCDGRLYDQLNRYASEQAKTNKVIALIIHDWYFKNPRLTQDELEGAVASIGVRYGIPVWWLPNLEVASRVIFKICKKVDEGKWLVPRTVWKQSYKPKVPKIVTLVKRTLSVPEKTAGNLLLEFGSLQNIFNAPIEALMNAPGVGKLTAERIYGLVRKDWRKKN